MWPPQKQNFKVILMELIFMDYLGPLATGFFYEFKKSHTCEEGRGHPRISVWHLLMNLKNNYLLKKLLKWANKKCKYFNIYKNKK